MKPLLTAAAALAVALIVAGFLSGWNAVHRWPEQDEAATTYDLEGL